MFAWARNGLEKAMESRPAYTPDLKRARPKVVHGNAFCPSGFTGCAGFAMLGAALSHAPGLHGAGSGFFIPFGGRRAGEFMLPVTLQDLVLVHIEGKPAFFARIEDISPDAKPRWWRVRLLVLTVPLQVCTWTLREEQINGEEFTMGGTAIRLEKVEVPETEGVRKDDTLSSRGRVPAELAVRMEEEGEVDEPSEPGPEDSGPDGGGPAGEAKVISLFDRKKE